MTNNLDENIKRITLYIEQDTHKKLKILASINELTINEYIVKLLEEKLQELGNDEIDNAIETLKKL